MMLCSFSLSSNVDAFFEADLDENNLFAEDLIMQAPKDNFTDLYNEQKSVNLTGQFQFDSNYSINRDWMQGKGAFADNKLRTYTHGDFYLDIRLKKDIKAFLDLGIANVSSKISTDNSSTSLADIKELFVDFNIERKIYMRIGKQYLQWGRNYFWNPVDLVNIERKNFLNLNASLAGTYGTRLYLPFGAGQNLYFFANSNEANNLDKFALVTKYEFLAGDTEYGLSMWTKKGKTPVYAVDFSTNKINWDITGEISFSKGSTFTRMEIEKGSLVTKSITDKLVAKAALNLSHSFKWEKANRINFSYEIFYNGAGYSENIFKNKEKKEYLFHTNLYIPNHHAQLYHACFFSIADFPYRYTKFSLNGIQNLVDYSGIISTGLSYQITHGFEVATKLAVYFGDDNSEFMNDGYGLAVHFYSKIIF